MTTKLLQSSPAINEQQRQQVNDAREELKKSYHRKKASLTDVEEVFLRALFLDDNDDSCSPVERRNDTSTTPENDDNNKVDRIKRATRRLNDDILFSLPTLASTTTTTPEQVGFGSNNATNGSGNRERTISSSGGSGRPPKPQRPNLRGLWKAFEQGASTKKLAEKGSLHLEPSPGISEDFNDRKNNKNDNDDIYDIPPEPTETEDDDDDAASDREVRHEKKESTGSQCSSWDENDHRDSYDAWEVLRDEYAEDFGFDYKPKKFSVEDIMAEDGTQQNRFRILGTSANDASCQPHVLSPPLMDAICNHLPDSVRGENFWLKFSLVRDGASLATLKQYVRASAFTILAVETPGGEVFGSFTSSAWRQHLGFFGEAPAFVWKMKHSRRTKCYSLFDQAQLESEIEVYEASKGNDLIQVCRSDMIAVGGDEYSDDDPFICGNDTDDEGESSEGGRLNGFAIALEEDLMVGTTSPCETFKSPSLCGGADDDKKAHSFEASGVEIWTFTPCLDVKSAERMEMSKFFVEESVRSCSRTSSTTTLSTPNSPLGSFTGAGGGNDMFTSRDLIQERFYRRVGDDSESQERRDRWQYSNMMNNTSQGGGFSRGFGATPRFVR